MADDIRQLKAEHRAVQAELAETKEKLHRMEAAYAASQTSLHELMQKTGTKLVKAYEYKEGECRPVVPHTTCPTCGWNYDTQKRPSDKNREPHPTIEYA